jgi:hypothetical protein
MGEPSARGTSISAAEVDLLWQCLVRTPITWMPIVNAVLEQGPSEGDGSKVVDVSFMKARMWSVLHFAAWERKIE